MCLSKQSKIHLNTLFWHTRVVIKKIGCNGLTWLLFFPILMSVLFILITTPFIGMTDSIEPLQNYTVSANYLSSGGSYIFPDPSCPSCLAPYSNQLTFQNCTVSEQDTIAILDFGDTDRESARNLATLQIVNDLNKAYTATSDHPPGGFSVLYFSSDDELLDYL